MQDYSKYQDFAKTALGVTFTNIELLVQAFTHRSYVNEHKKTAAEHNERLEFLGDAVLELVVTEYLYANYTEPEGILTNWRSALVRTESISAAATKLGYEPYLRLSRGERHGTSGHRLGRNRCRSSGRCGGQPERGLDQHRQRSRVHPLAQHG